MNERKQREDRIRNRRNGDWGATCSMYFCAVHQVFGESQKASQRDPEQRSVWVYAGIPVLLAGVEAYLIQHQHLLRDSSGMKVLAGVDPLKEVLELYALPVELQTDMEVLIETRNQIVHPSPLPFGQPEWPASLKRLHELKVIEGNTPESGANALAMLGSHRLFEWAVERCAQALDLVADSDPDRAWMFHRHAEYLWHVLKQTAPYHNHDSNPFLIGSAQRAIFALQNGCFFGRDQNPGGVQVVRMWGLIECHSESCEAAGLPSCGLRSSICKPQRLACVFC